MNKKEQKVLLKNDIIERVALLANSSKKDAETFLNAYHAVLTNAVVNNYRVKDIGYFDIFVSDIPAGTAFKPDRNGGGQHIERPASKRVVVKAGAMLRQYGNNIDEVNDFDEEDK